VRSLAAHRLRSWRGLIAYGLAVAIGTGVLISVREAGGPAAVQERCGALAPIASLLAHLAVETSPAGDLVPVPFAIVNGALYGIARGALLSWLAWIGASLLQFALARRAARDLGVDARRERLPRWLRSIPVSHPVFLIAARWVPMGGALASLAAGAAGVRARRLLWCTALGAAPPAVLLSAVGAGMLEVALGR
jgi:uncharacterized membrane protein YdjX (TVP38/TMEM64 family)